MITKTEGPPTVGTSLVTIANNHMGNEHELSVPQADVSAAVEKTYDIMGSAGTHNHTVTLTAADFASLAAGDSVQKTSSVEAVHSHVVTIRCGTT